MVEPKPSKFKRGLLFLHIAAEIDASLVTVSDALGDALLRADDRSRISSET